MTDTKWARAAATRPLAPARPSEASHAMSLAHLQSVLETTDDTHVEAPSQPRLLDLREWYGGELRADEDEAWRPDSRWRILRNSVAAMFDPLSVICLVLVGALAGTVYLGVCAARGVGRGDFSHFLDARRLE